MDLGDYIKTCNTRLCDGVLLSNIVGKWFTEFYKETSKRLKLDKNNSWDGVECRKKLV